MSLRCRLFGHDWRPDSISLFGVCRRCGVPSDQPQPGQNAMVVLSPGKLITDPDEAEALGLTVDARRMREAK